MGLDEPCGQHKIPKLICRFHEAEASAYAADQKPEVRLSLPGARYDARGGSRGGDSGRQAGRCARQMKVRSVAMSGFLRTAGVSVGGLSCKNLIESYDDFKCDQAHDDQFQAQRTLRINDVGQGIRGFGDYCELRFITSKCSRNSSYGPVYGA